uniref:Tc1-like transposase DDE domain-containing protein n=1 Tax=Kryptolebias marmoratus TaxID=37003 RepID=A0A3Q3AA35_KRYMA
DGYTIPDQSTLNFLIPSAGRRFGDDDSIFQDDNASCHRAKDMTTFLQERHIMSIEWPADSRDLNPVEIKKMFDDKNPTC